MIGIWNADIVVHIYFLLGEGVGGVGLVGDRSLEKNCLILRNYRLVKHNQTELF